MSRPLPPNASTVRADTGAVSGGEPLPLLFPVVAATEPLVGVSIRAAALQALSTAAPPPFRGAQPGATGSRGYDYVADDLTPSAPSLATTGWSSAVTSSNAAAVAAASSARAYSAIAAVAARAAAAAVMDEAGWGGVPSVGAAALHCDEGALLAGLSLEEKRELLQTLLAAEGAGGCAAWEVEGEGEEGGRRDVRHRSRSRSRSRAMHRRHRGMRRRNSRESAGGGGERRRRRHHREHHHDRHNRDRFRDRAADGREDGGGKRQRHDSHGES